MDIATASAVGNTALNLLGKVTGKGSSSADSARASATTTTGTTNVSTADFLSLLVSEITNQNPMEPMDNSEMIAQLASFQMVDKINTLTEQLDEMMAYQNMMNSVNMLGKKVQVYSEEEGDFVTGTVESIKLSAGTVPTVVVDGVEYPMSYVTEINPASTTTTTAETTE